MVGGELPRPGLSPAHSHAARGEQFRPTPTSSSSASPTRGPSWCGPQAGAHHLRRAGWRGDSQYVGRAHTVRAFRVARRCPTRRSASSGLRRTRNRCSTEMGDQNTGMPQFGRRGCGNGRAWRRGSVSCRPVAEAEPGRSGMARRFYVDPIVHGPRVRRWRGACSGPVDGGASRSSTRRSSAPSPRTAPFPSTARTTAIAQALIRDMLFDPDRPGARFAVGRRRVFIPRRRDLEPLMVAWRRRAREQCRLRLRVLPAGALRGDEQSRPPRLQEPAPSGLDCGQRPGPRAGLPCCASTSWARAGADHRPHRRAEVIVWLDSEPERPSASSCARRARAGGKGHAPPCCATRSIAIGRCVSISSTIRLPDRRIIRVIAR